MLMIDNSAGFERRDTKNVLTDDAIKRVVDDLQERRGRGRLGAVGDRRGDRWAPLQPVGATLCTRPAATTTARCSILTRQSWLTAVTAPGGKRPRAGSKRF